MATECAAEGTIDLAPAEKLLERYVQDRDATIALLQDVQKVYGYLPRPVLELIGRHLDLPLTQLFGLATFYKAFSLKPRGRHIITVCTGTTCHVKGAPHLLATLERELGCRCGQTDKAGRFSLERVNCVGACARAPIVVVDEVPHGRLSPAKVRKILEQYP
jgi:NADH-quinone oxidoreductase subunit E